MNDKNIQNHNEYEKIIIKGLAEIKEGQEMIIEGNKKIERGKYIVSCGIGEMNDEIEKLEFNNKKLNELTSHTSKGKKIEDIDTSEQIVENEQFDIEDIQEEEKKESKVKSFVKKLTKKKKKSEKERKAEDIARDFDMFGDGPIEDEEEYVFTDEDTKPKGERIRTGEYEGEGGLLTRRDRNRIIIIFFIAGMLVAILRAVFEGWPIIVWPPYNYFEVHENTLLRRFIRWFVDIIICEWILDFDIDPIEDDERHGNSTLYIKRQYRGVGAKNSYT